MLLAASLHAGRRSPEPAAKASYSAVVQTAAVKKEEAMDDVKMEEEDASIAGASTSGASIAAAVPAAPGESEASATSAVKSESAAAPAEQATPASSWKKKAPLPARSWLEQADKLLAKQQAATARQQRPPPYRPPYPSQSYPYLDMSAPD